MDLEQFRRHFEAGLISEESLKKVTLAETNRQFSVHWELRTLLYLGVVLLTTGLGILIYKNIDTIGHEAIIATIALGCAACFYYNLKRKSAFSWSKVQSPDTFYDYIVLLGCTLLVTLVGYLQFRYTLFGIHYGLALFIPTAALFVCAYMFDHLGILSMAITSLGAWVGVALTPLDILQNNAFDDPVFLLKAIALAVLLVLLGMVANARQWKAHFAFTYEHFGIHLFFIATYAEMILERPGHYAWFLLLAAGAGYVYWLAMRNRSFYFLTLMALYSYLALSTFIIQLWADFMPRGEEVGTLLLFFMYFIVTAILLILLLVRWHKKLKHDDRLQ